MFLPSLLPRWANGKSKALSQSSAYPGAFGRAWAFAHKIVMRNPDQSEYDDVVKTSARFIVTYLPPPGTLADEDFRFCLILFYLLNSRPGVRLKPSQPQYQVLRTSGRQWKKCPSRTKVMVVFRRMKLTRALTTSSPCWLTKQQSPLGRFWLITVPRSIALTMGTKTQARRTQPDQRQLPQSRVASRPTR